MHVPRHVYQTIMCVHHRFTGVSWSKTQRLWEAYVHSVRGKILKISLGFFANEEEAAMLVDKHRRELVRHFQLSQPSPLPQAPPPLAIPECMFAEHTSVSWVCKSVMCYGVASIPYTDVFFKRCVAAAGSGGCQFSTEIQENRRWSKPARLFKQAGKDVGIKCAMDYIACTTHVLKVHRWVDHFHSRFILDTGY